MGADWRDLIDHSAILPILGELLGNRFRLDHTYGMAARAAAEANNHGMHHHAGMFQHGCYYMSHGTKMHNGLVVVSWALNDIPEGGGGFCCVPGSHKAQYEMPRKYYGGSEPPRPLHLMG